MAQSQYGITPKVVLRLNPALKDAGLVNVDLIVNHDPDGDLGFGDGSVDDQISFKLEDDTISPFSIQCGPYGIILNEDVYENGQFVGSREIRAFEQFELDEFIAFAVPALVERLTPPGAAPGR